MIKTLKIFLTLTFIHNAAFANQLYLEQYLYNHRTVKIDGTKDPDISSPKSVVFHPYKKKFYINSLEGYKTIVYSWPKIEKLNVIKHTFNKRNQNLFLNGMKVPFNYTHDPQQSVDKINHFSGKPVESTFSHKGKYLWVTYYRRSFDQAAQYSSAVAIIDTDRDEIIRVMPTGPLPKMLAASPDGKIMAISLWGNNTVGLIDITSNDPQDFQYTKELTLGTKLVLKDLAGKNRDKFCGLCIRGTVFSSDSSRLYIAQMGKADPGISVFNMNSLNYMGTLRGLPPTPRHLSILDHTLYISSNYSGKVSRISLEEIEILLKENRSRKDNWDTIYTGEGARTFDFSKDQKYLFVTSNNRNGVTAINIEDDMFIAAKITHLHPYPVGLATSPEGTHIITTSQGKKGRGGNVVDIIKWTPNTSLNRFLD